MGHRLQRFSLRVADHVIWEGGVAPASADLDFPLAGAGGAYPLRHPLADDLPPLPLGSPSDPLSHGSLSVIAARDDAPILRGTEIRLDQTRQEWRRKERHLFVLLTA